MLTLVIVGIVIIVCAVIAQAMSNAEASKERNVANNQKLAEIPDFTASQQVNGIDNRYAFAIDKTNKKVAIVRGNFTKVIPFSQIMSADIHEDKNILYHRSALRTIGGAAVGAAVAGRTGAYIGAITADRKQIKEISKVQVNIKVKDTANPSFIIDCFDCKVMTVDGKPVNPTDMLYQQALNHAQRIADMLNVIIDTIDNDAPAEEPEPANEPTTPKANVNVPDPVREAIANGQLLVAVKLYKNYAGCSLEEAKAFIDSIK